MRKSLPLVLLLLLVGSPVDGGDVSLPAENRVLEWTPPKAVQKGAAEESVAPERKPAPKKMSPGQFRAMLKGKTKAEVKAFLGTPTRVGHFQGDEAGKWEYGFPFEGSQAPVMNGKIVYDELSEKTAYWVCVYFVQGKYNDAVVSFGSY